MSSRQPYSVVSFTHNRRARRILVPAVRLGVERIVSRAAYYNQVATDAFSRGESEKALQLFCKASRLDPHCPIIPFNLALLLQSELQYDEAVFWYRRATQLDPTNAQANFNLGFCLRSENRLMEAETSFRQGLRVDRRRADIWMVVGLICTERGDFGAAAHALRRAISLEPGNATMRAYLGTTLKDLGDIEGAKSELCRSLQIDPDHSYARFNLAWLQRSHGEHFVKVASTLLNGRRQARLRYSGTESCSLPLEPC